MGEALLEDSGEESGLSVEAGEGGIIPDEVVGLGNFGVESELRGNDVFGGLRGKFAELEQSGALGRRGASNDDYGGKMALSVGFV